MSKTYLDRKDPSGAYVFISYSHEDSEAVSRILTALNGYGADFWYDTKLKTGDNWKEKVQEVTSNKNCCGIIYFISDSFIFSNACLEEFEMYGQLQKTHDKFNAVYIFVGDEKCGDFNAFRLAAIKKLMEKHADSFDKVLERTTYYSKAIDTDRIFQIVTKDEIDEDGFVKKVFNDVFAVWGCASQEVCKIDALVDDGLITKDYRVRERCRIVENIVNCKNADWKVFNYSGDTLSAMLVSDSLYAATCLSLADSAMKTINDSIKEFQTDGGEEAHEKDKHFKFSDEFFKCLKADEDGNVIRFLRASEHENHYLRLKEALEKPPVLDAVDDGYFFVQDNSGKLLIADRSSEDVYRHIHVDAYASIMPVIDIDYVKYREYVLNLNKH